jgi:hypothetical protein
MALAGALQQQAWQGKHEQQLIISQLAALYKHRAFKATALFFAASLTKSRACYCCCCCCCVQAGICMVGMSSVLSGEGSSTHKVSTEEMLLGMGLIVMSQVSAHHAAAAEEECYFSWARA